MRFLRFCPKADISCIQAGRGLRFAQNKLQYRRKTVSHCGTQQRKGGALVENSNGGVQSVARIFALIEVLCAHPKGASLQTISTESGLPKSTAHRLLSSLVSLGYAVQDSFSTHYRLTMKMFELSSGIVNDMDIMSVAKPHLDKLSRHTGEAVHLVIQDGVDIVYIYKAEAAPGWAHAHVQPCGGFASPCTAQA